MGSMAGMRTMRDVFAAYADDIRVLAYIRPPMELFPSLVQQRLKRLTGWPLHALVDHPLRAKREALTFGEAATSIRIFSRSLLRDGDVVSDLPAG